MNEFKINVSRIEMVAGAGESKEVCITFKFERAPINFQIPIFLRHRDFDDTEMIRAARNTLHRIFADLANQCESWSLTPAELQEMVNANLRPTKRSRKPK
jgi:hypothetical protein